MTEKKSKPAIKQATSFKTAARKSVAAAGRPEAPPLDTAKRTARPAAAKKLTTKPAGEKKTAIRVDKVDTTAVKKATATVAEKKSATQKLPPNKAAATNSRRVDADSRAVKVTPEEHYCMVQTAAYFIAERHGFQGNSDEHWAAAEREIAARLG